MSRRYNITINRGTQNPLIRKEASVMKKMFGKLEKFMEEYYYSFHENRFSK